MTTMFRRVALAALLVALMVPAGRVVSAQEASQPDARVTSGQQTAPQAVVPEKKEEEKDENEAYRHSAMVINLGSKVGLGPEAAATAFTVLNFVVLAAIVGVFLLKSLPKTFKSRNTKIQKDLVDARTATEEATARLSAVEARLSKLDDEIAKMRKESDEVSARDEQRIKANIEDEKNKIVTAAEQEIAAASTQAQREIQRFAAELAIKQAAQKLVVTAETDRLLVASFAHRLGGDQGGQN